MALSERRLVLVLLALAVVGHVVRLVATAPEEAPGAITLLPDADGRAGTGPLARHRARVEQASRPLGADEQIDADRAGVAELDRLPGVGPVLAKRIVADRKRQGPFGGPAGLDRVPGVGPGLLARLAPHLSFSGGETRDEAPGPPPARRSPGLAARGLVNLNQAAAGELEALPGIGAVRARAIVAYREVHGPFATLESVAQVPGIGPSTLGQLRGLVIPP